MIAADPDVALLLGVARGDQAAIRKLIAAKLPRLTALGFRMLCDMGEAEDVAQETFLRAWKMAPRWQPGRAQFDTWLHAVALNLCRDRLRRRRERLMASPPDRADPTLSADRRIEANEKAAAVSAAIAALPDRQREAVILQYYQGLTNIAAAEVMGVGVEALESLLGRARRALRASLAPSDGD